ncbi:Cpe/LpqF family protein [Nonomuraea thailandensis]
MLGSGRRAECRRSRQPGRQAAPVVSGRRQPHADPREELGEHLTETFLKEVPAEKFNALAKDLAGLRLEELSSTKPTELAGVTSIPVGQKYDTKISVGDDGKIDYLLLEPR